MRVAGGIGVCALGAPTIWVDDVAPVEPLPAKAVALLVYLADEKSPVDRSVLAGLLWSDSAEDQARRNLRVTLSRLRSRVGDSLDADRSTIGFNPVCYDVDKRTHADPLRQPELFVSDFLDGFEPRNAALFNEWADARRAELRSDSIANLSDRAAAAARAGDWQTCQAVSELIVSMEPWADRAHGWIIESLAETVGRGPAFAHYDEYASSLADDLGIEPDERTQELVAGLRTKHHDDPTPHGAIPAPSTPFHGRTAELRKLDDLAEPGRPLAIVGPGGIGKSRLLTEYSRRRQARGDDVIYVSFDTDPANHPSNPGRLIAEEVLGAIGVPADSQRAPIESLHSELRTRHRVICLDNVESLGDVSHVIADLARTCPDVEILLATRRRLILTNGQILVLHGLAPDAGDRSQADHPSVRLFCEFAPHIDGSAAELDRVARVCELVDGHPLAIELAAHLTTTVPLTEVLDHLESSVDLATLGADVPERHRSLHGIVRASTAELTDPAVRLLGVLSSFAGSFSLDDVAAVAPGSTDALPELLQHSLVYFDGHTYSIHAVIRDNVQTDMVADDLTAARAKHAGRILHLCAAESEQGDLDLRTRSHDLRAAVRWRIEHGSAAGLVDDLRPYFGLQRRWGWVESTAETVERALERPDLAEPSRAELHRHAAEAMLHAGDNVQAELQLQHGLRALGTPLLDQGSTRAKFALESVMGLTVARAGRNRSSNGAAAEESRLMSMLGELLYVTDRRAEMASYAAGAVMAGRRSGEEHLIGAGEVAVSVAAQLAGLRRLSERSRRRGRLKVMKDGGDPFTASLSRATCALVAVGSGNFGEARADIAAAIDAANRAGRPRYVILSELLLALVAYHERRFDEVDELLDRNQVRVEAVGYRPALTWLHATRAEKMLRNGDIVGAEAQATAALEAAQSHAQQEDVSRALIALGRCCMETDLDAAAVHVIDAAAGLERDSSIAIQHFETWCSRAELAVRLGDAELLPRAAVARAISGLDRFARAVPIARTRAEQLNRPG